MSNFIQDAHRFILNPDFEQFILSIKKVSGHSLLIDFVRDFLYEVEILP
jgi:hypothetical protein